MKITSLDIPSSLTTQEAVPEELPEGKQIEELCTGLKKWENQINGFTVLRLHENADPKKRTPEWKAEARKGLDIATWLREHELIWAALEGKPVYSDHWSREFHASRTSIGWQRALPVCRGWDFGLYPATVFGQLFPHSRLMLIRELVGLDIDTERFITEVNRLSHEWFPDATFFEFVDPTGKNRVGTDGKSYLRLLTAKPLLAKRIIPGANSKVERRSAVVHFLSNNVKGVPCLLVDPSCDYLLKGFDGGYLYKYVRGTLKTDPEKNIFSHVHDGLEYMASRVLRVSMKLEEHVTVAEPRFMVRQPNQNVVLV